MACGILVSDLTAGGCEFVYARGLALLIGFVIKCRSATEFLLLACSCFFFPELLLMIFFFFYLQLHFFCHFFAKSNQVYIL